MTGTGYTDNRIYHIYRKPFIINYAEYDRIFHISAIIYMGMIAAFLWLLLYAHISACIQFMVPIRGGH